MCTAHELGKTKMTKRNADIAIKAHEACASLAKFNLSSVYVVQKFPMEHCRYALQESEKSKHAREASPQKESKFLEMPKRPIKIEG